MPGVTPYVMVDSAREFAGFIQSALGAEIVTSVPLPSDPQRIMHGEAKIGDSHIFFADSGPNGERCLRSPGKDDEPAHIQLWTEISNPKDAFERAVSAGASVAQDFARMEDGTQMGGFVDPWGTLWWVTAKA